MTKKGQFLIESWVAISILVIGFLGIFSLLSRSLSLNNVVASQYIASNLAAEGIEVVKNLIDGNFIQERAWNEGFIDGEDAFEVQYNTIWGTPKQLPKNQNHPLLFDSATGYYNYNNGQPTPFFRRISIRTSPDGNEMTVNSKVSWQIRGGSYSVNLEDHFFNWRPESE